MAVEEVEGGSVYVDVVFDNGQTTNECIGYKCGLLRVKEAEERISAVPSSLQLC